MSAVALHDDGWAIRALPPGRRDLGCHELWERSLARSRRRRAQAERRTGLPVRAVSAALLTTLIVVPAADLANAQDTTAGIASTDLRLGSKGPAVAAAQAALGVAADGDFGPITQAAVQRFQAARGLVADGVIGPLTRAALGTGGGSAGSGSAGSVTMALQRALGVAADGDYGPITRAAVRQFQATRGLLVDGIAGPQTLGALGLPTNVTLGAGGSGSAGAGAPSAVAGIVISAARTQAGKPYLWGGTGPNRWDCSGLTQYAFRAAGIELPRTTYGQIGMGRAVERANIQAGDLVFFDTDGSGGPSDVGIATSNTTVISATTSNGVIEHTSLGPYWGSRYYGTRRVG
jgi:cell wall-associated NlpC family hydrolase